MLHFQDPVTIVLLIFGFMVASALERFLTETPLLGRKQAPQRGTVVPPVEETAAGPLWAMELLYWSTFAILISIVFRFFIGASAHLTDTYVRPGSRTIRDMLLFSKDMVFLIVFGVFLVRLALSGKTRDFVFWLMMFFGASTVWCVIEIISRGTTCLDWWWLGMDAGSLVITLVCRSMLRNELKRDARVLSVLAVCCVIVFLVDLNMIVACRSKPEGEVFLMQPRIARSASVVRHKQNHLLTSCVQ